MKASFFSTNCIVQQTAVFKGSSCCPRAKKWVTLQQVSGRLQYAVHLWINTHNNYYLGNKKLLRLRYLATFRSFLNELTCCHRAIFIQTVSNHSYLEIQESSSKWSGFLTAVRFLVPRLLDVGAPVYGSV